MARVLVPLADGCEELEAVTLIDLLRRAGFRVIVAGLREGPVTASRGVLLWPDTALHRLLDQSFDLIALPGGAAGAARLAADEGLGRLLMRHRRVMAGRARSAPHGGPRRPRPARRTPRDRLPRGARGPRRREHRQRTGDRRPGGDVPRAGYGHGFCAGADRHLAGRERRDRVEEALQR